MHSPKSCCASKHAGHDADDQLDGRYYVFKPPNGEDNQTKYYPPTVLPLTVSTEWGNTFKDQMLEQRQSKSSRQS